VTERLLPALHLIDYGSTLTQSTLDSEHATTPGSVCQRPQTDWNVASGGNLCSSCCICSWVRPGVRRWGPGRLQGMARNAFKVGLQPLVAGACASSSFPNAASAQAAVHADPVNALEVIVRDDLEMWRRQPAGWLPRGLTLSFQNEPEKIAAVVRSAIKARAVQVAIASLHQIGIRTRNRRFRE
jgi:hypothetical protein